MESSESKHKPSSAWVKKLYDINLFSDDEIRSIYSNLKYQGFNREEMLFQLEKVVNDSRLAAEVVMLCVLRGPQQAAKTKLSNGKTPVSYGITASEKKGTEQLSCSRIGAALADLGAYYLKKMDIPKRVFGSPLPAWLQFPQAGSIKMNQKLREQHVAFSRDFSKLIGGEFNESIYSQMVANAYLDENLHLFDEF